MGDVTSMSDPVLVASVSRSSWIGPRERPSSATEFVWHFRTLSEFQRTRVSAVLFDYPVEQIHHHSSVGFGEVVAERHLVALC